MAQQPAAVSGADKLLQIEVGPERTRMAVCVTAVARASRVLLLRLLDAEPTYGNGVFLPNDEPFGLAFLLQIIHGNVDRIPRSLLNSKQCEEAAMKTLYEVAMAADRYDLVHILSPWADRWLQDVSYTFSSSGYRDWHAWRIATASILGDETVLVRDLSQLVLSMHSHQVCKSKGYGWDEDGGTSGVGNPHQRPRKDLQDNDLCIENLFQQHMPLYPSKHTKHTPPENRILNGFGPENLAAKRVEVIRDLLGLVTTYMDALADEGTESEHYRFCAYGGPMPPANAPSKFTNMLGTMGLFPLPAPESYPGSIQDLYTVLTEVWVRWKKSLPRHCGCDCPTGLAHDQLMETFKMDDPHTEELIDLELEDTQRLYLRYRKEQSGIQGGKPSNAKLAFYFELARLSHMIPTQ